MSTINVNTISDAAGSGAPNFPDGVQVAGNNVATAGSLSNRNWLINGDFSVWQRGTSHSTAGYGSVDRWSQHFDGTQSVIRLQMNQTRANEIKTACGHAPEYFVSYNVASFGTYSGFRTRIEDIMKASGQTVTFSIVAASQSGSVLTPVIRIYNTSAGISQQQYPTSVTTNSTMTRYEFTVTFSDVYTVGSTPDGTGFIEVELYTDRAGWHDFACFQLEAGDVATPFEMRSIGQELALCQRYYQIGRSTLWSARSTTHRTGTTVVFPVEMRTTPSTGLSIFYSKDYNSALSAQYVTPYSMGWTAVMNSSVDAFMGIDYTADAEL